VTTYWVDKDTGGSGDSGPGSQADPYATIAKALTVVSAGDTIKVVKATTAYSGTITVTVSGTSGNPITLEGADPYDPPIYSGGFHFDDVAWLVWKNGIHDSPTTQCFKLGEEPASTTTSAANVQVHNWWVRHSSRVAYNMLDGSNILFRECFGVDVRSRSDGTDLNMFQVPFTNGDVSGTVDCEACAGINVGSDVFHIGERGASTVNADITLNHVAGHIKLGTSDWWDDFPVSGTKNCGEDSFDIKGIDAAGSITVTEWTATGYRDDVTGQDSSGGVGAGITIHNTQSATVNNGVVDDCDRGIVCGTPTSGIILSNTIISNCNDWDLDFRDANLGVTVEHVTVINGSVVRFSNATIVNIRNNYFVLVAAATGTGTNTNETNIDENVWDGAGSPGSFTGPGDYSITNADLNYAFEPESTSDLLSLVTDYGYTDDYRSQTRPATPAAGAAELETTATGAITWNYYWDAESKQLPDGTITDTDGNMFIWPTVFADDSLGWCMAARIPNNTARYVAKSITASKGYRGFFKFKPGSLTMAEDDEFQIFRLISGGVNAVFMSIRFVSGGYNLNANLHNDGASPEYVTSASGTPLSNRGWHDIEFVWVGAASSSQADGSLEVWVDGVSIGIAAGVDNDTHTVDEVRFGIVGGVDAGTGDTEMPEGLVYFSNMQLTTEDIEITPPTSVPGLSTAAVVQTIEATGYQSHGLMINVFSPLALGSKAYIESIESKVNAYTHETRALGGYFSATISMSDTIEAVNSWVENGLGRHIEVYNPALDTVWEGFTNLITVTYGNLSFTIGPLTDIGNRMAVSYSRATLGSTVVGSRRLTVYSNNTDSQDIYGIIERIRSIGAATDSRAIQVLATELIETAFPESPSNLLLSGGATVGVTLDCLGYYHWLKNYTYATSTAGNETITTKLQAILADEPNANIFSTDYQYMDNNSTFVPIPELQNSEALTVLKKYVALGDDNNDRYTFGFYKDRKAVFSIRPSAYQYRQQITHNLRLQDRIGNQVDPWDVDPAQYVIFPDVLPGQALPFSDSLSTSLKASFIEVIQFTAPYSLSIDGQKIGRLDQMLAKVGLGLP